jgi:hypothetical protein
MTCWCPETETKSSLSNAVFVIKDMMKDNVQKCDSYVDMKRGNDWREYQNVRERESMLL